MPILASMDVSAAKTALSSAKTNHMRSPPQNPNRFARQLCLFAVIPRAVDGGANTDNGGTLGNGGGVIVAHPH